MDPAEDPLLGQTFFLTKVAPPIDDAPRGGNGSQVLPVATRLANDDGVPEDGMEYLFLVREQAKLHAKVYRASFNPYTSSSPSTSTSTSTTVSKATPVESRPSEEWRRAFLDKFSHTRFRMATAPASIQRVDLNPPAPKQESAWRIFVNGKRSKHATDTTTAISESHESTIEPLASPTTDSRDEDLEAAKASILAALELDTPRPPVSSGPVHPLERRQEPEYVQLPQLPTPQVVASLPTPHLVDVVSHFSTWFEERSDAFRESIEWQPSTIFAPTSLLRRAKSTSVKAKTAVAAAAVTAERPRRVESAPLPTAHEAQWILSLLSRVDDLLDGDDLSELRRLGRALFAMVQASEKHNKVDDDDASAANLEQRREREEGQARCWMILAALSGIWKQEDLWNVDL